MNGETMVDIGIGAVLILVSVLLLVGARDAVGPRRFFAFAVAFMFVVIVISLWLSP